MEKQHNRVRSSLQASECLTDRKDRVLLHGGSSVSIQPTPSIGTSGKRTGELSSPGLGRQVSRTGKRLNLIFFKFFYQVFWVKTMHKGRVKGGYWIWILSCLLKHVALPSLCCFNQTAHFLCNVLDTLEIWTKKNRKLSQCQARS